MSALEQRWKLLYNIGSLYKTGAHQLCPFNFLGRCIKSGQPRRGVWLSVGSMHSQEECQGRVWSVRCVCRICKCFACRRPANPTCDSPKHLCRHVPEYNSPVQLSCERDFSCCLLASVCYQGVVVVDRERGTLKLKVKMNALMDKTAQMVHDLKQLSGEHGVQMSGNMGKGNKVTGGLPVCHSATSCHLYFPWCRLLPGCE